VSYRWFLLLGAATFVTGGVLLNSESQTAQDLGGYLAVIAFIGTPAGAILFYRHTWGTSHAPGHEEVEFRVVARAQDKPIASRLPYETSLGRNSPEALTALVSRTLDAAVLQSEGLVLYRETADDANLAAADLRVCLDPLFAAPTEISVERWNEDLSVWHAASTRGANARTLATLAWEARIRCRDRKAARELAGRMRSAGEPIVSCYGRTVSIGVADESAAQMIATRVAGSETAQVQVRRLTRVRRAHILRNLHDRRMQTRSHGWLRYTDSGGD
jgi:hypothetical protein